jgi:hypothetical protein
MAALSTAFDYGFLPPADGKALERRAENIERIQGYVRRQTAEGVVKPPTQKKSRTSISFPMNGKARYREANRKAKHASRSWRR